MQAMQNSIANSTTAAELSNCPAVVAFSGGVATSTINTHEATSYDTTGV